MAAARRGSAVATKADLRALKVDLRTDLQTREGAVDERMRGMGVVLERIDSKVGFLAEALTSKSEELKVEIRAVEVRLSQRISVLEEVVRQNSTDIGLLRSEVAELRARFEQRDVRHDELEKRVSEVEKRLGVLKR